MGHQEGSVLWRASHSTLDSQSANNSLSSEPSSVGEQRDTASHSSSVPTLFCGRATRHSQPQLFSSNPLLWASNRTQPAAALQFQPSSVGDQQDTASRSSSVPTLFCGRATGHSQPQLFSSNPLLWASNRTQPATALQFQPSSVGEQQDTASRSSSVPTLFCGRATGHSQPQLFSSNPLLWATNRTQPAAALQFQVQPQLFSSKCSHSTVCISPIAGLGQTPTCRRAPLPVPPPEFTQMHLPMSLTRPRGPTPPPRRWF